MFETFKEASEKTKKHDSRLIGFFLALHENFSLPLFVFMEKKFQKSRNNVLILSAVTFLVLVLAKFASEQKFLTRNLLFTVFAAYWVLSYVLFLVLYRDILLAGAPKPAATAGGKAAGTAGTAGTAETKGTGKNKNDEETVKVAVKEAVKEAVKKSEEAEEENSEEEKEKERGEE